MASVKTQSSPLSELQKSNFDQFSRQQLVATILKEAFGKQDQRLKIIDLGGHKGKTQEFSPQSHVTILDVFDEEYPGYVKGDATNMTFQDAAFDVACSFDVFEHIPRPKRLAFIAEALRVSTYGAFIAMPVDDETGAVSAAEVNLNDIHKKLYAKDHPWLKEHIDYRIPNEPEVEALVSKAGAHATMLASNQVADWEIVQTAIFIAAQNPAATNAASKLNQWYNQHYLSLEAGVTVGYRRIYFISRNPTYVANVKKAIQDLHLAQAPANAFVPVHRTVLREGLLTLGEIAGEIAGEVDKRDEIIRALQGQLEKVGEALANANNHAKAVQHIVDNMKQSTSWRVTKPLREFSRVLRVGLKGRE